MDTATADIRELLTDSFTRIADLTAGFSGLDPAIATTRPRPGANTIAWLLWHLTRIQDDHIADLAARDQVWADGWYERFGLPFDFEDTGFGHSAEQVGKVTTPVDDLIAYHSEVHTMTLAYLAQLTSTELNRIVDRRWKPPVPARVRLVSVTGDCLQHLGQAAYIRGLLT